MKLFTSIGPNPRVVRMFMAEKGIEIPLEQVDLMKGENRQGPHLSRNPAGQTPALELDDGSFLTEITAICEYLDEVFPTVALRPSSPRDRTRMRVWSKWTDEVVIRAFQVANWNRMMAPTARQWSDEEVERRLKAVPVPDRREDWRRMAREPFSESEIAHAVANIRRTMERMEADLAHGPWLAGKTFSLADIHLSPYIVRLGEHAGQGIHLHDYPRCAGWWQRLTARPAFLRARIEAVAFKD